MPRRATKSWQRVFGASYETEFRGTRPSRPFRSWLEAGQGCTIHTMAAFPRLPHPLERLVDATVKNRVVPLADAQRPAPMARPSREEAEAAVRTLIAWTGDDPSREGLIETPARVARA